ncbi:MAG TPA: flavodoxin domain-containing protein [Puia sp.]|nr:flavodoxin domain-containing protein [Puia sp.]
MITPEKNRQIQELVASLGREELIWMKGFLEGVLAGSSGEPALAKAPQSSTKITIAYGTESGNSKKVASAFANRAKQEGIQTKVVSLDQYRLTDLPKEEYFLTVISTQGEGEPPASAKKFYDHIHQNGFKLPRLKYGVLALGDTSYPMFCKAGEDVDNQLQYLGGERLVDIQRCDVDYETDAETWFTSVLQKLGGATTVSLPLGRPVKKTTGKKIYQGTILTNINLNDRGSSKQTHHIEIAAEGVQYQAGDSIGIIPHNSELLVQAIIERTGIDPQQSFVHRDETCTAYELLHKKLNIAYLPERIITKYAAHTEREIEPFRSGLLELLIKHPVKDAAQFESFIQQLEPITPRLYSIASSLEKFDGEVHLTVGRDKFSVADEVQYGLCSDLLCALKRGDTIDFYVHHNDQFRLPQSDRDVIMIGPGTGIAPFRAFLAERESTGASGRNWLFFGDQHFTTDFLYQTEIQQWLDDGVLNKIDLAFSRDQSDKIYVQDKMKKCGKEFYEWIKNGATLYVCGAKRMSEDVEKTITDIIRESGEDADTFLDNLKGSGRYLKDVY